MTEHWGFSLDGLSEELWDAPELRSDAIGAHYMAFDGTRDEARAKMIAAFTRLVDRMLYRATAYGSEWHEGDDDEDAS